MAETDTLERQGAKALGPPLPDAPAPEIEAPAPDLPAPSPKGDIPPPFDPNNIPTGDLDKAIGFVMDNYQRSLDLGKQAAETGKRVDALAGEMPARDARRQDLLSRMKVPVPGQPPQFQETSPFEAFGSLGVVLAGLGSLFSRRPMTAALKASAQAINAIHAGDIEQYKFAYQSWKDQTTIAMEQANMENGIIKTILDDDSKSWDQRLGLVRAYSSALGDQISAQQAASGDVKSVVSLYEKRIEMSEKLADRMSRMTPERVILDESRRQFRLREGREMTPDEMIGLVNRITKKQPTSIQAEFELWRSDPKNEGKGFNDFIEDYVRRNGKLTFEQQKELAEIRNPIIAQWREFQKRKPDGTWEQFAAEYRAPRGTMAADVRQQLEEAKIEAQRDIAKMRRTPKQVAIDKLLEEKPDATAAEIAQAVTQLETASGRKIDQAILNEVNAYPGMTPADLGYIAPAAQRSVVDAFSSMRNIEHIADYVTKNPEAVGAIADALKRGNVDNLQSLDFALDDAVRKNNLDVTTAGKAKLLNKMVTTQSFADAQATGQRPTVYLDRVFRDIYQQASNFPTFMSILKERQGEADRVLNRYRLGVEGRADKEAFPFYGTPLRDYVAGKRGINLAPVQTFKTRADAAAAIKAGTLASGDQFQIEGETSPLTVK